MFLVVSTFLILGSWRVNWPLGLTEALGFVTGAASAYLAARYRDASELRAVQVAVLREVQQIRALAIAELHQLSPTTFW